MAFFSEVISQWKSTSRTGGSGSAASSRSASMAVNGESSWFMKTRPMTLMTATSPPSGQVMDQPAAAGHLVGVVERSQHRAVVLEVGVDLALVPDVVAAR